MDRAFVLSRLKSIFREVFDDNGLTISEQTSPENFQEWDSIAHVKLVIIIEEEFGVSFELGEVSSIKSVGEFIDAIKSKIGFSS